MVGRYWLPFLAASASVHIEVWEGDKLPEILWSNTRAGKLIWQPWCTALDMPSCPLKILRPIPVDKDGAGRLFGWSSGQWVRQCNTTTASYDRVISLGHPRSQTMKIRRSTMVLQYLRGGWKTSEFLFQASQLTSGPCCVLTCGIHHLPSGKLT